MTGLLRLETLELQATIDPRRGADVLSVVHRTTGTELLFATPWRDSAMAIRDGRSRPTAFGSTESWLEQYAGGWQTLFPNAGAPRVVRGAPYGYHGEASATAWDVVATGRDEARLRAELFSVPVVIDRTVRVAGRTLTVTDVLRNLSDDDLDVDYGHHPAFGGAFLEGPCVVATSARRFTSDPETEFTPTEQGSSHDWPLVAGTNGPLDLTEIPAGPSRGAFGWLSDFADGHWASVTNPRLGLTARLEWDGAAMPYAWFWQELESTSGWPWYRRARVAAIEPSSTPTSGPDRASVIRLAGGAELTTFISLTVDNTGDDE